MEYCNAVVTDGTGHTARPAGYAIGGKTGTAETLPRGNKEYVVSFFLLFLILGRDGKLSFFQLGHLFFTEFLCHKYIQIRQRLIMWGRQETGYLREKKNKMVLKRENNLIKRVIN